MSGTVRAMERDVAELVGETDVEALTRSAWSRRCSRRSTPRSRSPARSRRRRPSSSTCCSSSEPNARVFALDTHVLFPETYARLARDRAALRHPDRGLRGPVARAPGRDARRRALGEEPRPLLLDPQGRPARRRALRARRLDHGRAARPVRRAARTTPKLGWDERHELWKASPLADWTDDDVWAYIHERELPVNPLHERGYASIGCTHCTAPGTGREGRWAGTGKTECGLHA